LAPVADRFPESLGTSADKLSLHQRQGGHDPGAKTQPQQVCGQPGEEAAPQDEPEASRAGDHSIRVTLHTFSEVERLADVLFVQSFHGRHKVLTPGDSGNQVSGREGSDETRARMFFNESGRALVQLFQPPLRFLELWAQPAGHFVQLVFHLARIHWRPS
jgi:hypothetical protein